MLCMFNTIKISKEAEGKKKQLRSLSALNNSAQVSSKVEAGD